jgi:hypothetical protein
VIIVLYCTKIIGTSNIKYIILNLSTTPVFTKPRCKKKNAKTAKATQGHIKAKLQGFFSFQLI